MQVDYYQDSLDTIDTYDVYDAYEESYESVAMPQISQSMLGSWVISVALFLAGILMLMVVDGSMGPA